MVNPCPQTLHDASGDTLEVASTRLREGTLFQVGRSTAGRDAMLDRYREAALLLFVLIVLVGLASCLTAGVASVAQNRGIQLRSVESKVEGSMDIRGILGIDSDVRNGYDNIKVTFKIDADAPKKDIEALVAQSQKRSAVFDIITNPTDVTVTVDKE